MKIAYFDCIAGASGDMIVGAMLDAGLSMETLEGELARLGLGSVEENLGPPRPGQWPADGSQQPTRLEAHGLDGNGDADGGWNSERFQSHIIVA